MYDNFLHYLYSGGRVSDMILPYCRSIYRTTNPLKKLKAEKLLNYRELGMNSSFLADLNEPDGAQFLARQIAKNIDKSFNLNYELIGRLKDLCAVINKVEIIEEQALFDIMSEYVDNIDNSIDKKSLFKMINSDENSEAKEKFMLFLENYEFKTNPFDRIRDFLAFRIIIEDEGKGDYIDEIYQMANMIIELINNDVNSMFHVVESVPITKTGPLKNTSSLIFIPKKTGMKTENLKYVKDYIIHPKSDGYQSLHMVFYDPVHRQFVELQIRTRSMDLIACTDAKHENYKRQRYGSKHKEIFEKIDFSKIKLNNNHFRFYNDYIYDAAGITCPFTFDLYTESKKIKDFIKTW